MAQWGRWIRAVLLAAAAGLATAALADRASADESTPSPLPIPLPSLPVPEISLPPVPPLPEIELPILPEPELPEIVLPSLPPGWPWPQPATPPPADEPELVDEPEPEQTIVPPPRPVRVEPAPRPEPHVMAPARVERRTESEPVRSPCPRRARPVLAPQTPPVDAIPPPVRPYRPAGPDVSSRSIVVTLKPPGGGGSDGALPGLTPGGPVIAVACCGCGVTGVNRVLAGRTPGRGPPPPR